MAYPEQLPAAAIVMAVITMAVVLYLIMIYPEERTALLEDNVGVSVNIDNNQFVPASLTIKVNSKVTWKNSDSVKHSVIGADFGSGVLNPGERYSHTFTKKGVYDYSCEFHPGMRGTIIVE